MTIPHTTLPLANLIMQADGCKDACGIRVSQCTRLHACCSFSASSSSIWTMPPVVAWQCEPALSTEETRVLFYLSFFVCLLLQALHLHKLILTCYSVLTQACDATLVSFHTEPLTVMMNVTWCHPWKHSMPLIHHRHHFADPFTRQVCFSTWSPCLSRR